MEIQTNSFRVIKLDVLEMLVIKILKSMYLVFNLILFIRQFSQIIEC